MSEYSGKVGHEKKNHKTHFTVVKKKLKGKKGNWKKVGVGRYILVI